MSPGSVNALKYRAFQASSRPGAGPLAGAVRWSGKLDRNTRLIPRETMTEAKFHVLDGFPRSVSPSSHATEADGLVFLTGQFGRHLDEPTKALPEGIRAQTDLTLRNMGRWRPSTSRLAARPRIPDALQARLRGDERSLCRLLPVTRSSCTHLRRSHRRPVRLVTDEDPRAPHEATSPLASSPAAGTSRRSPR